MRAGQLRHRVEIQRLVAAQTASGMPEESWVSDAVVWGQVSPGKGGKVANVDQMDAPQPVRIRVRYRGPIDTSYRVAFEGKVYEIISATDWEERRIYWDLDCVVHSADGLRGAK